MATGDDVELGRDNSADEGTAIYAEGAFFQDTVLLVQGNAKLGDAPPVGDVTGVFAAGNAGGAGLIGQGGNGEGQGGPGSGGGNEGPGVVGIAGGGIDLRTDHTQTHGLHNGIGVCGFAADAGMTSNVSCGVFGSGFNEDTSKDTIGVFGLSNASVGVHGISTEGIGVRGVSHHGVQANGGIPKRSDMGNLPPGFTAGVFGHSELTAGVAGDSTQGVGVHGHAQLLDGVRGESITGTGVHGIAIKAVDPETGNLVGGTREGVLGESPAGIGVHGMGTGDGSKGNEAGAGVFGESTADRGGVFFSRQLAQIQLQPNGDVKLNAASGRPEIPGLPGDLLATTTPDANGNATTNLWFFTSDKKVPWKQVMLS